MVFIAIGHTVIRHAPGGRLYAGVTRARQRSAPDYGDTLDRMNVRTANLDRWQEFVAAVGLRGTVFDAETFDCDTDPRRIGQADIRMLRRNITMIRRHYPEAAPRVSDNYLGAPGADNYLAFLGWLLFWVRWACKRSRPAIQMWT